MKLSKFKCLAAAISLFLSLLPTHATTAESTDSTSASFPQKTRYERKTEHYKTFWEHLIPNQTKIQYAGSIGAVSASAGWHYGHKQRTWETDLYFGYLPKFHTRRPRLTMAVKQSYVPFRIAINEGFGIEPLSCGMFFSTIFGEEFWSSQPSKYPRHYYGFSTKIRANAFIGQRLRFPIPSEKRRRSNCISFYYELSTNELYLISYFTNKYLSLADILSLSIGLKFDLF